MISDLNFAAVPKLQEDEASTRKKTVSSRSSTYCLTKVCWDLAVTFQSIVRISSPGTYSRTSANSMPCPLKTDSYSPPRKSSTNRVVVISIRLTCRKISRDIMGIRELRYGQIFWKQLFPNSSP